MDARSSRAAVVLLAAATDSMVETEEAGEMQQQKIDGRKVIREYVCLMLIAWSFYLNPF